jgi:hypothetical protein
MLTYALTTTPNAISTTGDAHTPTYNHAQCNREMLTHALTTTPKVIGAMERYSRTHSQPRPM